MTRDLWPALPLDAWRDTCETLHRWAQILGKVQLALTPTINHWWNAPLEITPRGFSTSTLVCDDRWLDLELDFLEDVLRLRVSDGTAATVPLAARPVAELHADAMVMLQRAGIAAHISPIPAEVEDRTPFDRDTRHHAYDRPYVVAFWHIVARSAAVLAKFRAGFVGKSSPVQFYWGHLDLTLSRFSGRRAPPAILDAIEREAYSHELFSVGWWAGDSRFEKPAYYAYAAPEPPGFATAAIATPHAYYHAPLRGFYLDYDEVRRAPDPEALILDFCNATYEAAADLGGWDRAALERDLKGAA
ncbi:MAG TPA: DUF5996 family protein [Kofleriaceae bacterium]|nr:DUF5996 family protein [Kofleriaceae bacterium]